MKKRLYEYSLRREMVADFPADFVALTTSARVAALVQPLIGSECKEHFLVLFLNGQNRVTGFETVSVGSMSSTVVHPREAFRLAVMQSSAAVVFAHNHPSGRNFPSLEDTRITKKLKDAGELLGIPVLDHVIITESGAFYSFADSGTL